MARRRIGQEELRLGGSRGRGSSSLDEIAGLIDWAEIDAPRGDTAITAGSAPGGRPSIRYRVSAFRLSTDRLE